jgi:hypothetical protein
MYCVIFTFSGDEKFICMQNKGYGSVSPFSESDHPLVPNQSDFWGSPVLSNNTAWLSTIPLRNGGCKGSSLDLRNHYPRSVVSQRHEMREFR